MTTYLLIQTEAGRANEAAKMLRAVAPADTVEVVQGPFDIIAIAKDAEVEKTLMNRCTRSPFIRVLPCRSPSARSDR